MGKATRNSAWVAIQRCLRADEVVPAYTEATDTAGPSPLGGSGRSWIALSAARFLQCPEANGKVWSTLMDEPQGLRTYDAGGGRYVMEIDKDGTGDFGQWGTGSQLWVDQTFAAWLHSLLQGTTPRRSLPEETTDLLEQPREVDVSTPENAQMEELAQSLGGVDTTELVCAACGSFAALPSWDSRPDRCYGCQRHFVVGSPPENAGA